MCVCVCCEVFHDNHFVCVSLTLCVKTQNNFARGYLRTHVMVTWVHIKQFPADLHTPLPPAHCDTFVTHRDVFDTTIITNE